MKLIVALIIILIGFFSATYATTPAGSAVTDVTVEDVGQDFPQQQPSLRRGERSTTLVPSLESPETSLLQEEASLFEKFFAHKTAEERRALSLLLEQYSQMNPEDAFQLRINQLNGQQQDSGALE